jgi:hypothetical protein
MINSKFLTIAVVSILLISTNVYSQKESVILYNSQPVKVELSDLGTINAFIGLVPGYMAGYDLTPSESVNSTIVSEQIEEAPVNQNAGYAIVSAESIELQYQPNFATLDKALINKLNDIAARLKSNYKLKILITAQSSNQTEGKLTKNRLASAVAYLGIKGISPDRIKSEIQEGSNFMDVIVINYLN